MIERHVIIRLLAIKQAKDARYSLALAPRACNSSTRYHGILKAVVFLPCVSISRLSTLLPRNN